MNTPNDKSLPQYATAEGCILHLQLSDLMPGQQQTVRKEYLIPGCAQSVTQTPASVQECVRQASQVAQLMHSRRTPAHHTGIQAPQNTQGTQVTQVTNIST